MIHKLRVPQLPLSQFVENFWAMFLAGPGTNVKWGMTAGFLAGLGWVAMAIAIIGVFENRSWAYILINGGYMSVALVIMGAIIGAWR